MYKVIYIYKHIFFNLLHLKHVMIYVHKIKKENLSGCIFFLYRSKMQNNI